MNETLAKVKQVGEFGEAVNVGGFCDELGEVEFKFIANSHNNDLKRVAPMLGFSGYQALVKAYIAQGLRTDLERLEGGVEISALVENLRKKGINDNRLMWRQSPCLY